MAEEMLESREAAEGEADLPETIYDLQPNASSGSFTIRLPDELHEAHGFEGTFLLAFEPVIVPNELTGKDEIEFIARRISDPSDVGINRPDDEDSPQITRQKNVMRMWASSETVGVTFPREFATGVNVDTPRRSTLYNEAKKNELRADVESPEKGVLRISFQPSAVAWQIPNDGGMDAFSFDANGEWPVTKTLVRNDVGPYMEYESLRVELPASFRKEPALDLEGGEQVATRIASRDGEPVVVLDFDVHPNEKEQAHVRTIFEDDTNYQMRVLFSQQWASAFGWDHETELSIEPGPNRIVVARAEEDEEDDGSEDA